MCINNNISNNNKSTLQLPLLLFLLLLPLLSSLPLLLLLLSLLSTTHSTRTNRYSLAAEVQDIRRHLKRFLQGAITAQRRITMSRKMFHSPMIPPINNSLQLQRVYNLLHPLLCLPLSLLLLLPPCLLLSLPLSPLLSLLSDSILPHPPLIFFSPLPLLLIPPLLSFPAPAPAATAMTIYLPPP